MFLNGVFIDQSHKAASMDKNHQIIILIYALWFFLSFDDLMQQVDDTLAVFHTHAVAGLLGGILTGLLAEPTLCSLTLPVKNSRGAFYGHGGGVQLLKQLVGALFVIGWNIVSTTAILLVIKLFIPLRMPDEELIIGDDAVHGEEAYALWGDGEKYDPTKHGWPLGDESPARHANGARGVTIQL